MGNACTESEGTYNLKIFTKRLLKFTVNFIKLFNNNLISGNTFSNMNLGQSGKVHNYGR